MPPSFQLTSIHLRVANLSGSLTFYCDQLGFVEVARAAGRAALATAPGSPPLLILTEDRTAPDAPSDAAGLFHAAMLLPSRASLGGWLRRAADAGVRFDGFSDHGVSEAIYLADPDGNGLEFYADRPRESWPFADGKLAMDTRPLALPSLLAEAAPGSPTPLAGARWGHLHLRVTNLAKSESFYRENLNLELMQDSFAGARFLAADGYHHHLGLNIWGRPHRPQVDGALGLVEATVAGPHFAGEQRITDPDSIAWCLTGP